MEYTLVKLYMFVANKYRVKLEREDDSQTDFINASFMKVGSCKASFTNRSCVNSDRCLRHIFCSILLLRVRLQYKFLSEIKEKLCLIVVPMR